MKKPFEDKTSSIHFVIESSNAYSRLCVFENFYNPTEICNSKFVPYIKTDCIPLLIEDPLLELSEKDAVNSILKTITEMNLSFPKSSYKNQFLTVLNLDGTAKKNSDIGIIKSLLSKKIESTIVNPTEGDLIRFISKPIISESSQKTIGLLVINSNSFSVSKLSVDMTSYNSAILHKSPIGFNSLYEEGENEKIQFKSCKQSISSIFTTETSGEDNFKNCKNYILEKFRNQKKLNLPKLKSELAGISLQVYGDIWEDTRSIFPSNKVSKKNSSDKLNIYCKRSSEELIASGIPKNLSLRLCYTIAFTSAIMEFFEKDEIGIIPSHYLSLGASTESDYFKDCAISPIPKKK